MANVNGISLVIRAFQHLPALAAFLLSFSAQAAGTPDLIVNGNAVIPQIVVRSFSSTDCEVVEGCISAGTHKLMTFAMETWNIGSADLVVGNPTNNPLFYYSQCHGHYHFDSFAQYNLVDPSGRIAAVGHKSAFCMEDVYNWDPNANPNRKYDCSFQGIQAGWSDVYDPSLPCQWVDITGVPPGQYFLQLIVNPLGLLPEPTNNNVTIVPVTIPGGCIPPPNDNFVNAQVLSGGVCSVLANNNCATKEPGEPSIAGNGGGVSIWYSWIAPYTGQVLVNTVGSDFDTLLAVYSGTAVNALNKLAENDDIVNNVIRQSQLTFNAVQGTQYSITVDGYNQAVGLVQLNINPPANDFFTNCQPLSGTSGTVTGYNIGATKEPGEPAHAGSAGGASVWYCWTAPTNGLEIFDTIGSDFDSTLAVYTGNSADSLTPIASDNDSGGNLTSLLSFNALAGTTYHVAFDGFATTNHAAIMGNIVLHWYPPSIRLALQHSGSSAQLTLSGTPGSYAIEYSTDLKLWQSLTTVTMTGSSFQYTSPLQNPIFYRAKLVGGP